MKTIIYYFSRTNTTRQAVAQLAAAMGAESEEILDRKDWSGPWGWLSAGRSALQGTASDIKEHQKDPAGYDLVILATPVWAGTCSGAIRAFAAKHAQYFKKVAFMTTQGGAKRQRVFGDLAALCRQEAKAELMLTTKQVRSGNTQDQMAEFIKKLG